MAYEDPYFGPNVDAAEDIVDLPPEAADGPNKVGLIIALLAGGLVLIGLVIGLVAGRSSNSRD